ncbi:hypothetical protein HLASF_0936 [Halanaeroarchaeum sulfurireducens]|uniref:Sulfatase n=1 Tax=Halanaeroarchaeum sulfurireducens TaxID=1604004 RepID=A0A0F7P8D8_9EURY|nr:hypothetical protein HLASF_0936 [Halanaeroarchaeum sulfurireducens]ALG81822.1 hypothetical protein HLASA_0925 [Halanaeroarchaeum sulfurireducens]
MSFIDRLSRALQNPRLFFRGANRAYHRRAGLRLENKAGTDVVNEDWDTLVVLDACRYDMFESTSQLDGELSSRISKGSATTEWLQANFDKRDLRDTVYVTANPQLEENRDRWDIQLHETINVWLDEGWDDETGTVRAETMTEAALEAAERFPHKRLVVHYMQPHYPFVPAETDFDKEHLQQIDGEGGGPSEENVWNQKFNGTLDVSREKLWEVYTANLEYVLEHVEELLADVSGRTVVTADHGNYVGERASPIPIREWGHPRGLYDDPVVRVPWLVSETGDRHLVVGSSADDTTRDVQKDVVAERLRDLGYRS